MTSQEFLLFSDEEIALHFAQLAKQHRLIKNITQKDFANKTGVNYSTYKKFERTGETSFVNFITILRHLGKLKDILNLLKVDDIDKLGVKAYVERQNITIRKQASPKSKKTSSI